MKRIYISGPISGHDLDERRKVFEMAEVILEKIGFEPVNPIAEADRHPEDVTTHQHMHRDIALLLKCDGRTLKAVRWSLMWLRPLVCQSTLKKSTWIAK